MRAVCEAVEWSITGSFPKLTCSLVAGELVDRVRDGFDRRWRHLSGVEGRRIILDSVS